MRSRFGDFAVHAGNRSLTVAARLRLLLIQRELPRRDREGAVARGEDFPKARSAVLLMPLNGVVTKLKLAKRYIRYSPKFCLRSFDAPYR